MKLHETAFAILLCVPCLAGCGARPIHAKWDGKTFTCPPDTDLWADEGEAVAGKNNFVYCMPNAARKGEQ